MLIITVIAVCANRGKYSFKHCIRLDNDILRGFIGGRINAESRVNPVILLLKIKV